MDDKPKNDTWKSWVSRLGGDLERLGKGVEKALHEAAESPTGQKVRGALDEAGPQLKKAVEQVGPGFQKLVDEVGPQVKKVVEEVRPQVQKVVEQVGPEVKKAIDQARPVVKGALDELLGKPAPREPSPPPGRTDVPPNISPDVYTTPEEPSQATDDSDAPEEEGEDEPAPPPVKTIGRGPRTRKPDPARAPGKKTLGKKKPT